MKNILEEILTDDLSRPFKEVHPTGCRCRQCSTKQVDQEFFWDWIFPSSSKKTSILSNDQLKSAAAYNRRKAKSLGWDKHRAAVSKLIRFSGPSTDEEGFAEAVARWQSKNGYSGKDVDGKIGSGTWGKMQPVLGIGTISPGGPFIVVNTPMPSGPTHIVDTPRTSYAIPETIKAIEWIAREWHRQHPNVRIHTRHFSKKGGGKLRAGRYKNGTIRYHKSHRIGLDADLALLVKEGNRWRRIGAKTRKSLMVNNYNTYKALAKSFVDLIVSNPIMKVKVIWFFDHKLHCCIPKGNTSKVHRRHFHVRFCMPAKYKSQLTYRGIPSYQCRRGEECNPRDEC